MKGFRWLIMGFIFFAYILNFMDRSALSYVIEPLQKQFGLNNQDFGFLYAAFGISYLFMTIIGGLLVDRLGSRKILTVFSALWSIVSAMMAMASGFFTLLILRVALGLAEGPAFPALTRVSADWLPTSERARALALSLAAIPFASVIGAPFISSLIILFNWQVMFMILGTLGLIWSMGWYFIFRDKPKDCKYVSFQELIHIQQDMPSTQKTTTLKTFLQYLVHQPQLITAYLAYFCLGYLLSFSVSWWPGFLHQTFDLHLKEIGWLLCIPWLCTTGSILYGGNLSDKVWQKTHCIIQARFNLMIICNIASAIAFLPLIFTNSLHIAILSISLGLSLGLMPIAPFYAINSDLAKEYAGTSQGLMSSCLGIASFIAPALTGYLTQKSGNFHQAITVLIALMLISAVMLQVKKKIPIGLTKNQQKKDFFC
jgi:sugar phosphate permease